jgi:hypothetical protein
MREVHFFELRTDTALLIETDPRFRYSFQTNDVIIRIMSRLVHNLCLPNSFHFDIQLQYRQ